MRSESDSVDRSRAGTGSLARGKGRVKEAVSARRACRSCASASLATVLDLGSLYVSNFVDSPNGKRWPRVPLELVLCQECSLLQLRHTTPAEWLYRQYWYKSGVNASMRTALAEIAAQAEQRVGLRAGDAVLDVGCNDGTLLRSYTTPGIRRVGFEPAKNLVAEARQGTDRIINDFFRASLLGSERFQAITSIAMFYDLDDPNTFVADVARALAPEGVWILEMHYLPMLLARNAFDAICHEHLEYYALGSLRPLLARHGLDVVDVETNEINGGSFRVYARHAGRRGPADAPGAKRVREMLAEEKRLNLTQPPPYLEFAQRVRSIGERLRRFLRGEVAHGKQVFVYGASTKGNTLLQYFGFDCVVIRAAADRNPEKWGKYAVGSWIPIVSEEEARSQADYFLVLPWHFLEEFQVRERAFLARGGGLVVPLPEPRVIAADGIRELA